MKDWINAHDIIIGVPCSKFKNLIDYNKAIITPREDVALGIAIGYKLMGKNPLLFLQDSGLGSILTLLTSVVKYYNIKIDILISIRKYPEYHNIMGEITIPILKLLNYKNYRCIIENEKN